MSTTRSGSMARRRVLTVLAGVLLAFALALPAQAANPAAIGFDVVIVRPLRVVAVGVGAAFFLPAALFCSPGGMDAIEQAYEKLVQQPYEQAFEKPLGEF